MSYPVTKADLLATAKRLREQAASLSANAQYADSAQARNADEFAAKDCIRRAEQMEKEVAAMTSSEQSFGAESAGTPCICRSCTNSSGVA